MMYRSRTCCGVVAGMAALIVSACSAAESGTSGAEPLDGRDQTAQLVVSAPVEPPDWNYVQNAATAIKALMVHNVVEPLVERTEDGEFEPLLAESYEISEDGLVYVFKIREATFHDGSELTASDVVYSLEYNRSSPHGEVSIPFETVEAIEAVDERTVEVTLSVPSQRFLEGMSRNSGLVIPEDGAEGLGQAPIGTGPFAFGQWRPGVEVALSRFEDYWGDKPYFESVSWRFIDNGTAALNALLAGDVDVVMNTGGDVLDRLQSIEETEGFAIATRTGSEISYVSLNAADPAFEDPRVRQAIAHAIDRQAIVDGALAGTGEVTCAFVNPPTEPWSTDRCPYPYDPERARELLSDAGVEDLNIEFKFLTSGSVPAVTEIITSQLAEVGITIQPQGRDFATFVEEVMSAESPDYQMTYLGGPQQIDSWTCPGWFTRDCVPEFDDLLARADSSTDASEWAELRREAVELHADRAFLIPVQNGRTAAALRDDLVGVKSYMSASEFDMRQLRWTD